MNRLFIVTAVLVLAAAGCASSADTTDGAPVTTSTAAPATTAPETTAPATTQPPQTTTTAAATTTINPGAAALAAIAGTYEGSWTNTTFGSTGAMSMTINVSDASDVTIDIDIDGFVFGASNPDAETYAFAGADLGSGAVVESPTFGPTTISAAIDGSFTLEANEVPDAFIESILVTGAVTPAGFIGVYEIVFSDGGGAEGVFEMTP